MDDFEYDEEYQEDGYDEEEDEYEVYLNTRGGKYQPYPTTPVSSNRRPRKSESRKEETLRTPQFTRVDNDNMEIIEDEPISHEAKEMKKDNGPKSARRRLLPAPIESLTEFNVATYLQNLPCGLSVGQAAHVIPTYRSGLSRAVRRSRKKAQKDIQEANLAESDEEPTTAVKCVLRVGGRAQTAIVDSGAATSIIT